MADIDAAKKRAMAMARARAKLAAEMSHPETSGEAPKPGVERVADAATNFAANGVIPLAVNTMFPQAASQGYKEKQADGALFGFADNLSGGANALAAGAMGEPMAPAYEAGRDDFRARSAKFAAEHPTTAATADIAGVLAGAGALSRGGLTLMPGKPMSALGAGARGGAEAAGYGGLHSAGRRDGTVMENLAAAGTGAAVGAAIGGPLSAGTHALANALARKAALKSAPDLPSLKRDADAAYSRARAANPNFPNFKSFASQVRPVLDDQGFRPKLHPKVAVAVDEIEAELKRGVPDFRRLESLRRVVKGAASSIEPDEKRLGTILVKGLDDYMESAAPMADVATGRKLYGRYKRGALVDEMIGTAERRAARTGSGGNIENTIRQNIDKILSSEKLRRGFSAEDLALMERVVTGGIGQDKLRLVGKLSPSGNGLMAALMGVGGGAAAGATGNPLFVAPMVAGMGAKAASDSMTKKTAQLLAAQVRSGRPISGVAGINSVERALAQYAGARPAQVGNAANFVLRGAEGTADELVRLLTQ